MNKKVVKSLKMIVFAFAMELLVVACTPFKGSNGYVITYEDELTIATINYNKNIKDYSTIIISLLDSIKDCKQTKIIFEKGEYSFYPENARTKNLNISNNDSGIKQVVFDITEFSNIEIDGGGSDFMFYGKIIPFHICETTKIKLRNFSILWDSPFVLEGMVINNDSTNQSFDIKILDGIKYKVDNDSLFYSGYNWSIGLGENIVYDAQTHRPMYYTSKYEHDWKKRTLKALDMGNGIVRLTGTTGKVPPVGSIYTDKGPHGKNRLFPAIFIDKSKSVIINDINIFDSGAMALICQKTEDVSMSKLNVMLARESKRMISASADATHFVNCKGTIKFDSCRFENMLDDATNVHGTYQIVDSILSDKQLTLSPGHYQQNGFELFSTDDSVGLVDRKSLQIIYRAKVKSYKIVTEKNFLLTLDRPLPKHILAGSYVVENLSWKASMIMRNCTIKQNRARSILISTSKPVLVENNYFSSMMAGIRICGDANYWFESGEVDSVIIRNNTFEEIGIGGHSPQAVLQIDPIIGKKFRNGFYYHRNIVFEKNTIKTFDPLIVYALSVKGLVIRDNIINQSKMYKPIFDMSTFDIHNCSDVLIENNIYKGSLSALIAIDNCDVSSLNIKPQIGFSKELSKKINHYFYQD